MAHRRELMMDGFSGAELRRGMPQLYANACTNCLLKYRGHTSTKKLFAIPAGGHCGVRAVRVR